MKYIAAVDIGGTNIKYGVVTNIGELILSYETPTEAKKGGEALMNKVISLIGQVSKEMDKKGKKISGIGISSAGQIDVKTGSCIFASDALPGWTGMKIKDNIQEVYKMPVYVDNDVNAMALGETWMGAGKNHEDFICLTIGTGIGGAIVKNKAIEYGSTGSAGEFGHATFIPEGKLCQCGQRGCFEMYASTNALVDYVKEKAGSQFGNAEIDGRLIFEQAQKGNKLCKEGIEYIVNNIAYGLKTVTHYFNPDLIVLGGGVSEQGKWLMDKIDSKLKSIIMPSYRHVELQEAELGNRAGMIGATYGVLKKHFEKELYKTNKMINLPERIKNNDAKMKINIEYNL